MDSEQFVYWLQGFFEIADIGTSEDMEGISPEQARIIRNHLDLVFNKVTPTVTEITDKDLLSPAESPPPIPYFDVNKFREKLQERLPSNESTSTITWGRDKRLC